MWLTFNNLAPIIQIELTIMVSHAYISLQNLFLKLFDALSGLFRTYFYDFPIPSINTENFATVSLSLLLIEHNAELSRSIELKRPIGSYLAH